LQASAGGIPFPQAAFLQAAIDSVDPATEPVPFIETRTISVAQLSNAPDTFDHYPIVLLNDIPRLPKSLLDKLIEHTLSGNGLWMILGPRTDPAFLAVVGKSPLASFSTSGRPALAAATQTATQPVAVSTDIREPNHPIFQLWDGVDQRNPLGGVTLREWWPITPESPQLHAVVATTTGDPLILDTDVGKTGGRLVIWTSPGGNDAWNNLHLVPNFTPLVNETLFHLASGQNSGQPRQIDTGSPILWTGPASHPIDSATLTLPNGTKRTLQPQLRGDTYLVGDRDTYEPGLYELRFSAPPTTGASPPPTVYFSVNIDAQELDPTPLSAEDLQWFKSQGYLRGVLTPETLPAALGAQPGGVEVWWMLGIVLFGLLLTEVIVTRHLARKQGAAVLEEAGILPAAAPALESAGAR
jgi:hypothetical protein